MRAAMWTGAGVVEVREVPPASPSAGLVRVRIRAAGICATDLHIVDGRLPFARPPMILGHELAGEVVGGAPDLPAGTRVAVASVLSCHRCPYCRRGMPHLCDTPRELGITVDGGWREEIAVPRENLVPLPAGVSWEAGALLEPLNCTLGAMERVEVRAGDDVLILGSGPAGLLFVQLARLKGAGRILLVGTTPARQALGRALGADYLLDAGEDVLRRSREICDGMGPDLVIEAVGSQRTIQEAFRLVRRGGQVLLYGLHGGPIDTFDTDGIVMNALTVIGHQSSPGLWAETVKLVATGRIQVDRLVTGHFLLAEAPRALEAARDEAAGSIKVVLEI